MKNRDMKHYTRRHVDYHNPESVVSAIIIVALIATLLIDWHQRKQIISQANHAIVERDRYIDELENVIDQIYMQQTRQHELRTLI